MHLVGRQASRHGAGEVAESYTLDPQAAGRERGERIGETGPSMGF